MNKFCNFIEDKEMFDPLLVGGELYMDQEPSLETSSPIDGFFCRTEWYVQQYQTRGTP